MRTIVMPRTGLTMETGKINRWRLQEGDSFSKGDILLEIESDKAILEVEAQFNGRLVKIIAREGEIVPVSAIVAEAAEERK